MQGIIIAGTKSGIGKTTITIGLMKVLKNVSPFKVGPDYIDGKFHEYVTKNKSYNLDYFLMGKKGIKYSFLKNRKNFSIIEGVMGLYDGLGDDLDNGSTAHISRILNIPVILVVDANKRSTSICAEILGYKLFDERVEIKGIILNNISSEKSYEMLSKAIEKYVEIPCIGYLPKIDEISLESRHLGLIQAEEIKELDKKIEILAEKVKKTIDINKILEISNIDTPTSKNSISDKLLKNDILINEELLKIERKILNLSEAEKYKGLKIGVAKDNAFSFYYNDNLEFLERLGIEIKYFSPINDEKIPENVDGLYFGGGYPELYGKELEKNKSMIESIKTFYNDGGVIYGECGGYIYLSQKLKTLNDETFKFVGLTNNKFQMKERLNIGKFGYINVNCALEKEKSLNFPAHEFHYSEIIEKSGENIFKISKKDGRTWECGYSEKNLFCGYPHIHFFSSQDFVYSLLDKTKEYHDKRNRFNFMNFFNFRKGKR
ncbi:MAG: cobyrinate a,c-diamide synthase [Fusobacterium perfoetens]|uniref:cobyrinate a,c-diamide synthase n=1 Tax=Fusobacterium perfoetens TaxID=852 RepID=UPI0023F58554|nr:cobyrinate a,c-diamide synthase [Fusobacterium perfoetens]MCI6151672.1 cobyrinate a,c-diamide synthase [Fusobacterium perfoetens]MDY3236572.1 cobyrinate a,c-diamide synthase [Fusobacterium perfoetens]